MTSKRRSKSCNLEYSYKVRSLFEQNIIEPDFKEDNYFLQDAYERSKKNFKKTKRNIIYLMLPLEINFGNHLVYLANNGYCYDWNYIYKFVDHNPVKYFR